jgi:Ca2+-binding EF-hand superfamily protein
MRKHTTKSTFVPSPRKSPKTIANDEEIEAALKDLFDAFDVDESGELDREEFLKIQMRLALEKGEVIREAPLTAKYS